MISDKHILLGVIGAAHGIKGEVRLKSYTEDPHAIATYGPLQMGDGTQSLIIVSARLQKSMLIVKIKGIDDRNQAEGLNGVKLFVERSQLPAVGDDDEYYHTDIIGLKALTLEGEELGVVIAIPNFGAGDLLEIAPKRGETLFIPFRHENVPEIDVINGHLIIVPLADNDEEVEEEAFLDN